MSTLALLIGLGCICSFKLWGLCERGVLINMGIRPYNSVAIDVQLQKQFNILTGIIALLQSSSLDKVQEIIVMTNVDVDEDVTYEKR